MKGRHLSWPGSVLLAVLSLLFAVTVAFAQTEVITNDNVLRFGEPVIVTPDQVLQNAISVGGNVELQPGARVTKTAIAVGGDLILRQGSRVDGDAYSVGGNIIREAGATVGGAISPLPGDNQQEMHYRHRWGVGALIPPMYFFSFLSHLLTIVVSALAGLLLLQWRPHFLPRLADVVRQSPATSALWGVLAIVALIALNIFLVISLIGIPLIPLVNLLVFIAMWLGGLGVVLLVGEKVQAGAHRTLLQQFLIGLAIVAVVGLVPVVGGVVLLVVNTLGLGALLIRQFGKSQSQVSQAP